jgi:prophage tail gpP-like protein
MTRAYVRLGSNEVRWKSVTVTRALDAFVGASAVVLPLTPRGPVAPGERLYVSVGKDQDGPAELLLQGWVDAVSGAGGSEGGEITLEGRDRTADMVDGTRIDERWVFRETSLLEVARTVCRAYGIPVRDDVGAGELPIQVLIAQPGETAYDLLERAARLHGVLLSTSPDGQVVLGTPARESIAVALQTGPRGNVERYSWRNDGSRRFRRLKVIGVANLAGLVEGAAWRLRGVAEDPSVRSQREGMVVAQGSLVGDELEALAAWHMTLARARSASLTVTVPRWRPAPGQRVWRPGMVVPVDIAEAGIRGELMVAAVRLTLDDAGEYAELGLVDPAAYEIDPTEAQRLRRGSVEALAVQ